MNDIKQLLNLFPESDAVQDAPDTRDIIHEDVFGTISVNALPEKVYLNNTLSQNQNLPNIPSTRYACVFFAMTHATNEQNFLEWRDNPEYKEVKAFEELSAANNAKKAYEAGLLKLDSGAFIQDGPKFAMKLGLTAGYTLPKTIDSMKSALAERQPIQIATNKIDWVKTIRDNDNVVVPGQCYSHSMSLEGYDNTIHGGVWILRNSLGEFGKYRGRHFLKYEDTDLLFPSKYAYVDKSNKELMDQYRANLRVKRAIEAGLITNIRMEDFGTRIEASYIIERVVPGAEDFWSKASPFLRCSRQEFMWMFEKAAKIPYPTAITRPKDYITRREMALLAITMYDLIASRKLSS